MIRGGPDRTKVSQKYTLKRLDYSRRMAQRLSEIPTDRTSTGLPESTQLTRLGHAQVRLETIKPLEAATR
jgi:hypothetical protein